MNQLPDNAGKCQCIAFNAGGFITESDNTLFNCGRLMGQSLLKAVPFIASVHRKLHGLAVGDAPLYFPRVRLCLGEYTGTCDLFFTRIKRASGEIYIWFIYDYTLHYGRPKGPVLPRQVDTGINLHDFMLPGG